MKSLVEILSEACLNEAHIKDLKGVRYIRHYTTLRGLSQIIQQGYIKANESTGDDDWAGYNIGAAKVVSFHDTRTDPEIENMKACNDNNIWLETTNTLGLHWDSICAFIEYNFDILPENIQKNADFIRILEHYVPEFCELWNKICDIKYNLPQAKLNKIKKYQEFIDWIEKENVEAWLDIVKAYQWFCDSDRQAFLQMLQRKNLKPFPKMDQEKLLDAAIADDKKLVFNILKQHGWKNGDEYCGFLKHYRDWEDHTFLDYIQKRFLKSNPNPINIEIRMACDMPINIKGCTIYFFKGMADYIYKTDNFGYQPYMKLLDKLQSMSNVEIYEPGDDYSLIN